MKFNVVAHTHSTVLLVNQVSDREVDVWMMTPCEWFHMRLEQVILLDDDKQAHVAE